MANNADNHGLESNLLAWSATRAANWPHLFASVIDRYLELNELTEDELSAYLHCDHNTLNHLRLCGRPDPDPSAFALDIQRVADKLGLDAGTLASIVREVDAAEAFGRAGSEVSPFSSTPGMLKAARDHDEGPGTGDTVANTRQPDIEAKASDDDESEEPEDNLRQVDSDKGDASN